MHGSHRCQGGCRILQLSQLRVSTFRLGLPKEGNGCDVNVKRALTYLGSVDRCINIVDVETVLF